MAKKKLDEIVCIIDKSGSMGTIRDDAIGGFNNFLKEQKKIGTAKFTLVLFDHKYSLIHDGIMLGRVKKLDSNTYKPSGMTALLDAIGKTLDSVKERIDDTEKEEKPKKVIVAILTDGYENHSTEYERSQILEKITGLEKEGWEFIFLAANQDAIKEGASMGIHTSFDFDQTSKGVADCFHGLGFTVSNLRG